MSDSKINRRIATGGLLSVLAVGVDAMAQGRPAIPTNYSDLVTMARAHVAALNQGHAVWGFGREEHWSVDLDRGAIEWNLPGNTIARASAQLIGTWASDLGTFRWGWDHAGAPAGSAIAAQRVRDFADAHGIAQLQAIEAPCTREQGYDFGCIAVLIGDLQGLYVGQASRTALAYLGFDEVNLSHRDR